MREGKVCLMKHHCKKPYGRLEVQLHLFLTHGAVDVNVQLHSSITLRPLKNPIVPLNRRLERSESQSLEALPKETLLEPGICS